jgi:hypothetical protein
MALVICVFAIIVILTTTIVTTATVEQNSSVREVSNIKAYYIARSGADAAAKAIISDTDGTQTRLLAASSLDISADLGGGGFVANAVYDAASKIVTITSVGTYDGHNRTVTLLLDQQVNTKETRTTVTSSQIFDSAIFQLSSAPLDLTMGYIVGPIRSNGSVIQTKPSYTGTTQTNANRTLPDIVTPFGTNPELYSIKLVEKKVYKIDRSGYYGVQKLNNVTLIMDTTAGDLDIVMDELDFNCEIRITGTHRVNLYINRSILFQTGAWFNNLDPSKLIIYLNGSCTFKQQANGTLNAYIYGPNANINLNSSGTVVNGGIVAYSFDVKSNSHVNYVPVSGTDPFIMTVTELVTVQYEPYYVKGIYQ